MRFKLRAGIHYSDALGGYTHISDHGFLLVRFSELGLCKRDSDLFFKYSVYFINSNPRKINYTSSLSCNPFTRGLDSAFSSTW